MLRSPQQVPWIICWMSKGQLPGHLLMSGFLEFQPNAGAGDILFDQRLGQRH